MIDQRMRVNRKKFGEFIATRREQIEGIETQEKLATKLHVSTGYMGKLESGGGLPSFDLFIDLADALLMTPGELIMVMAERADPHKNYMEMNDWLYEKLLRLLMEYERLSPYDANMPLTLAQQFHQWQAAAKLEEVDRQAIATPDVKPPSGESKPIIKPESTENSVPKEQE